MKVIIKCRSRIHDQVAVSVAVAVDCALRLRTFAQNFLNLRAKPKFVMHIHAFIVECRQTVLKTQSIKKRVKMKKMRNTTSRRFL